MKLVLTNHTWFCSGCHSVNLKKRLKCRFECSPAGVHPFMPSPHWLVIPTPTPPPLLFDSRSADANAVQTGSHLLSREGQRSDTPPAAFLCRVQRQAPESEFLSSRTTTWTGLLLQGASAMILQQSQSRFESNSAHK